MSCFDVKILDPNINTIEIETCIGEQPSSIDIVTFDNTNTVEINHCIALLPSEINDLITVKDILAGSGISVSDSSGIYTISLSNPTIYTSGIVDFLEGVQDIIGNSGLVGGNYININYNDTTGLTTISATGLQPSGNYSVVGHTHSSSDISNFNSSVSGLLPNITGAGYVLTSFNNNLYTISVSGLQPSGNYSLVGHTHSSSDITDFSSSVSGLLPVKNISAGSGIGISSVSGDFTVSVTGTFGLTSEEVDDRVSNLLVAGNYINLNYNDLSNTLTVSASGLQPSGNYSVVGHSHSTTDITNFNSGVSGLLPSVTGSSYISASFNNNIYTISASGLQPSGNYSVVGHTHTSSEITDFNSAVSGLIPPSNFTSLSGVSGVVVTNSGTNYYVGLSDPTIQLADITDLSSDARTFLLTPSSTNLSTLISDETGSGSLVFNNSPAFSGTPTVPTAPSGTNNTQIASTAFVRTEISNLVDSAPSTLDTLNELAAALGDDPNFATTLTNALANKADLSGATFTGSVTIPSGTGNFNSLTVNGTGVSLNGHTHTSSQITDFNSSVSGLLPVKDILGGTYISVGSSSGLYTINATGLQPSGNYSVIGHTHTSSEITDFNSGVSGLLPSVTGTGYVTSSFAGNIYTIDVTGLQPSGNYSLVGHSHTSSSITDFNSSVSGLLPVKNILGSGYINVGSSSGVYTISATGLQPSGNYSVVGHTHTSSNITDFNSSVSGLIPVKDISAGSGINISSLSGIYTIATTGNFGLTTEEVDDRVSQLLVAGTGVSLTYNDPSGTLTIDNLHTEINVLSQEPQGFVNRTDSAISFNDATRTFTIQPTVSGGSYAIYIEGTKVIKNSVETVVLGTGTALNYIHFDTTPPYSVQTKTTGFNFDTDVPIAFIHWNDDINQSTFFGEERHGIRMDSVTHKWIHNTFGVQYISGLSIGGYVLLGNGSSNSHAQIDISDGILYQEDIIVNITDDNGTNSANEFVQPLSPIAYIPVYYHSGSTGQWVRDVATTFPIKYNATRAQYNLYSGGTWTTPNVTNNRYFAMWIVATNDMNDPILAIMGQREDSSLTAAESNNNWSDINLTNIPTQELRPLYRLIFVTNDTFTNTPKSSLQSILDIRVAIQSTVGGVTQNDHGSLFGLADDDHPQYAHIDNNRTISAIHTFTNGLVASGLISATSGNFTTLQVNGTGVSLTGHTHSSSNITDFNSSVSGLLPGVTGAGYITSSFAGNVYTLSATGLQPSGNYSLVGHTHTSSEITDFNSSVSGLLPITNIVAGSNVTVSSSGTIFTIAASGGGGNVNNIIAGSGISVTSSSGDFTISAVENIINSNNLYLWANFR